MHGELAKACIPSSLGGFVEALQVLIMEGPKRPQDGALIGARPVAHQVSYGRLPSEFATTSFWERACAWVVPPTPAHVRALQPAG